MNTDKLTTYSTVGEIEAHHRATGKHFFDAAAKRFFNSRIGQAVYGGRYFITSERFDHNSPRLYTIRECVNGSIETVGEFQAYESSAQARAAIKRLLEGGN